MFISQLNSSATASSAVIEATDPLNRSLPIDIDPTIMQPTGPVLMFCWIISHNGGNKVYRCKLCGGQFTGSPILAMTHFNAKMSNQKLKLCKGIQPRALKDQLKILLDKKLASETSTSKKRKIANLSDTSHSIAGVLARQSKPLADAAVLEFLVTQGLAASFVDSYSFRKLLKAVRDAGSNYLPPLSHALGKDAARANNSDGLGHVLHALISPLQTSEITNAEWCIMYGRHNL